jgi:hypothetical protein
MRNNGPRITARKDFPVAMLSKLVSRFQQAREVRESNRRKEAALTEAVQRVMQLSAPVVGTLRNSQRNLRAPVETALAYIDQTIALIPGPLPLSPETWGQHPLLQALFVGAEEIKAFLWADRRLKSFFARHPEPRAWALLTATRCERTIFGTAVEGEIVRRDVAQTAVEFRDHRILDPAVTLAYTRHELRARAMAALVTPVVERALQQRSLQDGLREQQRILSVQLKIQQTRSDRPDGQSPGEGEKGASENGASGILADIDRQIRELSACSASPEVVLHEIAEVLNAPQAAMTVHPVAMRLNWMGVKQCQTSSECDLDVRLVEVELKAHWRRTAVFVSIERGDVARP